MYSLLDEAWIPVLDTTGQRREVGLIELFEQAGDLRMIACELPTQTFAILRLALAILHRAADGPSGVPAWTALWRAGRLPMTEIIEYLDAFRDRFDLFHPEQPFYQVAGLRAGKDPDYGLERLIADVPAGTPFLTSRAGPGLESISPSEAARWLVHCQAYDPSGIKTGAVGDPRVKGGKVYPLGVASVGALGGIYLEGADLRETLLVNLIPVAPGWREDDERDLPIWERDPQTAIEESPISRGPYGVLGLYTWQSRRIRLIGDRDRVTGAMISYGDVLDWQDRHALEPMSVWGRSAPSEKEQKRTPIYRPRTHDHTRALWRGMQTLLPPPPAGNEPSQRLSPMVVRWLAGLAVGGIVGHDFQVRTRAVSIAYGTQSSVVDEVFGDALTMNVLVLDEHRALRATVLDATGDAEAAVKALRQLATNLVRAAGGDAEHGNRARASERAYALLDGAFRGWLARLGPDSDPVAERTAWQQLVRRAVRGIGDDLVEAAGPAAWAGRSIVGHDNKQVHCSSYQADAWFRAALAKALPLAFEQTDQKQEVAQ